MLFVLLTLTICTSEPTDKSCGSSVVIVATFADHSAFAMNLKFLKSFLFERLPDPKYFDISLVDPIDVLVSCKIYPSTGGLAVASLSFGRTYLTLYRVSFDSLLSFLLLMNVLGVAAPRTAVPRVLIVAVSYTHLTLPTKA